MLINEIVSAEEKLKLVNLIFSNTFSVLSQEANAEKRKQPKPKAVKAPKRAPYAAPPKPLPKPIQPQATPQQIQQQQKLAQQQAQNIQQLHKVIHKPINTIQPNNFSELP